MNDIHKYEEPDDSVETNPENSYPMNTFNNESTTISNSKTKSIKELLESNNSDIDFIEKSDSTSIVDNHINVIKNNNKNNTSNGNLNFSDTSSGKTFPGDDDEDSINFENIDIPPIISCDDPSPAVSIKEKLSILKFSEDITIKRPPSSITAKPILKNKPEEYNNTLLSSNQNVHRKDNIKCRSMMDAGNHYISK